MFFLLPVFIIILDNNYAVLCAIKKLDYRHNLLSHLIVFMSPLSTQFVAMSAFGLQNLSAWLLVSHIERTSILQTGAEGSYTPRIVWRIEFSRAQPRASQSSTTAPITGFRIDSAAKIIASRCQQ